MLYSKTRASSTASNKPRVYCTGMQQDVDTYFDKVCELVLNYSNCAVYRNEAVDDYDADELLQMQLIVIIITRKYITEHNLRLLEIADKNHIPVLPLIIEQLTADEISTLNGILCNRQSIDISFVDNTAMPIDEKLKKFIDSVLVSDEEIDKIKSEFKTNMFLSYRKKNRKYANSLIKTIHSNDFCRDVGIWYDEFLTLGENFDNEIQDALKSSEIFALAVTPDLINEENYVKNVEYPEAVNNNKIIIPFEMAQTDKEELKNKFDNIPDCIACENKEEIASALRKILKEIGKLESADTPEHKYYIGLAYLNGIYTEKNSQLGTELIEESAKSGYENAMYKMCELHLHGIGVERNFEKAIYWHRMFSKFFEDIYRCSDDIDFGCAWLGTLEEETDLCQNFATRSNIEYVLQAAQRLENAAKNIKKHVDTPYINHFVVRAVLAHVFYSQNGGSDGSDLPIIIRMNIMRSNLENRLKECINYINGKFSEREIKVAQDDYGKCASYLADLLWESDREAAQHYLNESHRFSNSNPRTFDEKINSASIYLNKYFLLSNNDLDSAMEITQKAEELLRDCLSEKPDDIKLKFMHCLAVVNICSCLVKKECFEDSFEKLLNIIGYCNYILDNNKLENCDLETLAFYGTIVYNAGINLLKTAQKWKGFDEKLFLTAKINIDELIDIILTLSLDSFNRVPDKITFDRTCEIHLMCHTVLLFYGFVEKSMLYMKYLSVFKTTHPQFNTNE